MTKKTLTVYSMVFLFAFTFAFAFAMEARAEDPGPMVCCTVFCEDPPYGPSYNGWIDDKDGGACKPPYNPNYPKCLQEYFLC